MNHHLIATEIDAVHPAWVVLVVAIWLLPVIAYWWESESRKSLSDKWNSLSWLRKILAMMVVMAVTILGADKGDVPIKRLFRMLFWHTDMTWMLEEPNQQISYADTIASTASNRLDAVQMQADATDVGYISFDWHVPNRLPDVEGAAWHDRQNVLAWTCKVVPTNIAGVLYEDHYVAFTHQASTNPAVINIEYAAKLPDGTVYRQTSSTITNSYPDIVQVTLQSGTYDCYWFRCQVPDFFARPEYIRDWNGEALFGSPVGSDRGFDLTGVLVIDDGDDVWLGASGEFDLGGGEVHSFTNGIDVTQVILENGGAEL